MTDNNKSKFGFLVLFRIPAFVAVVLLGIGAIILTVGVSLAYSLPIGLIVFGLILLALGVLLGLTS